MWQAFNNFLNPTPELRAAMALPIGVARFKAAWNASWCWPVIWRRVIVLFVGFQLIQVGYLAVRGFQTVALERQAAAPLMFDEIPDEQPRSQEYTVWGHGTRTCGTWTAARDNEPDGSARTAQMSWLGGYMSAFNNYGALRSGTPKIDFDGMEAWITRYCRQHPLDNIAQAAAQLAINLQAREIVSDLPQRKH